VTAPPTPTDWTIRVLSADGGGPAAGVPVTLLDAHGDPAGHWTSDAGGQVTLPRQPGERILLRLGLRNEAPLTVEARELDRGVFDVTAPRSALPAVAEREPPSRHRERQERAETPGHLLAFSRLLVAPSETPEAAPTASSRSPVLST
jgi:hypothetical protein